MNYPRLIPLVLLKQGLVVRSAGFHTHQVIGNPISTIGRFSHWNADELIIIDISDSDHHDLRRDDLQQRYAGQSVLDVLAEITKVCFMPLTFGGRIVSLLDIERRLATGADKVSINTAGVDDPGFIRTAAENFGSQAIVASIDVLRHPDGRPEVYVGSGKRATGLAPVDWARRVEDLGAGEILLNSIDRDGQGKGYDLDLIHEITEAVTVPVIACGGVGRYEDLSPGILQAGASAVAAANIFHFCELSYPFAKKQMIEDGVPLRPVKLNSRWFPREPIYDQPAEEARVNDRLTRASERRYAAATPGPRAPIRWCKKCLYPSISAAPMEFDEEGVCTGCRMSVLKDTIPPSEWDRRKALLKDILERNRSRDGSRHDCVIAVSGGKDSWFQIHVIKNELGLNPLLVTYDGNNWTEVGFRNLLRMKEVFGCDHIVVSPSTDTLKKLNRLGVEILGDMSWHAHVGITTVPVRVAVENKIPIVIWGEHGYLDLCGQFDLDDFPEMSFRDRLEHFARGYEWNYFVGREGLQERDLIHWRYPSDQELYDLDCRGIYLGNYVFWDANKHVELIIDKYGFELPKEPFDRTYRMMSNLDDMHENGAHDYLKFIKFGYGRCTDHVSKDIRAGLMTREEGIELIKRYDPVKPKDLYRWLSYVGMDEDRFDRIADTFRDPRVWWTEDGEWKRHEIS
jgi:imidazoleglycerol phosphate synthase cyclase subunit